MHGDKARRGWGDDGRDSNVKEAAESRNCAIRARVAVRASRDDRDRSHANHKRMIEIQGTAAIPPTSTVTPKVVAEHIKEPALTLPLLLPVNQRVHRLQERLLPLCATNQFKTQLEVFG